MNRTLITSIAAVIAFGGVATAQPAQTNVQQVSVSYGDLNLSREEGAQILVGRIQAAAETICGERPYLRDLTGWALYRSCVKHATDRAVASIHEPVVARVYGTDDALKMASK